MFSRKPLGVIDPVYVTNIYDTSSNNVTNIQTAITETAGMTWESAKENPTSKREKQSMLRFSPTGRVVITLKLVDY